jgi:hypothetical protein
MKETTKELSTLIREGAVIEQIGENGSTRTNVYVPQIPALKRLGSGAHTFVKGYVYGMLDEEGIHYSPDNVDLIFKY